MKNIAIIGGGNSGEREVSLKSLDFVYDQFDHKRYKVYKCVLTDHKIETRINGVIHRVDLNDFTLFIDGQIIKFDFVYNMIHGTPGEDGLLEGMLDLHQIPYSSSGVLLSALSFNKAALKHYLKGFDGIEMAKSIELTQGHVDLSLLSDFTFPLFIKPNKGGSSVGVFKVEKQDQLASTIKNALQNSESILVEEFIEGTEITCGVFQDFNSGKAKAIDVTEIIFDAPFFDYKAKYESKTTQEITPARIDQKHYTHCKSISEQMYDFLGCRNIVRIDYILKEDTLYFIELNSIPGMSKESIVPRQLKVQGVNLTEYLTNLIEALVRV